MINKGIVYRRVPAVVLYGVMVPAAASTIPLIPEFFRGISLVIFPVLFFSLLDGAYWFPGFARANRDEVGIENAVWRGVRRTNLVAAALAVAIMTLILFAVVLGAGSAPT